MIISVLNIPLQSEGKFDAAFEKLRIAVKLEDGLPYDEPWGIMQPCRHALGKTSYKEF